jgi:hypothetical protein
MTHNAHCGSWFADFTEFIVVNPCLGSGKHDQQHVDSFCSSIPEHSQVLSKIIAETN